jgi:hypothetical protein
MFDRKTEIKVYEKTLANIPEQCASYNAQKLPLLCAHPLTFNTYALIQQCITVMQSNADDDQCITFLGAVHRSFLSDAFIAIEFTFEQLAEGLTVFSQEKVRAESLLKELQNLQIQLSDRKVQSWLEKKLKTKPNSSDKIHAVLNHLKLEGEKRKEINSSVNALRILRNKSAHGWPKLSKEELEGLHKVNLPVEEIDGLMAFRVVLYIPIIKWLEQFFSEVLALRDSQQQVAKKS